MLFVIRLGCFRVGDVLGAGRSTEQASERAQKPVTIYIYTPISILRLNCLGRCDRRAEAGPAGRAVLPFYHGCWRLVLWAFGIRPVKTVVDPASPPDSAWSSEPPTRIRLDPRSHPGRRPPLAPLLGTNRIAVERERGAIFVAHVAINPLGGRALDPPPCYPPARSTIPLTTMGHLHCIYTWQALLRSPGSAFLSDSTPAVRKPRSIIASDRRGAMPAGGRAV